MYPLKKVLDSSVRNQLPDIGSVASIDAKTASLMVWNYKDDDVLETATEVSININHIPTTNIFLSEYRIDQAHSNSYEVWKKMGSPQQPTKAQIAILEQSGQLELFSKPEKIKIQNGNLNKKIALPSQGVTLFKIDWN
jgi:xylan 1,4-beta-xylosidase